MGLRVDGATDGKVWMSGPGPECLNGPGVGGAGRRTERVSLGPHGASCFTAMGRVPVIVLRTPRAKSDPSMWPRERKPRGRQGLEVQRRRATRPRPAGGKLRAQTQVSPLLALSTS